ncbi:hypothetical protein [Enterococcus gilvus]|uniref:hypothetical protein n=1 Tax=Enterococcus gilvus TaxID=160453 RepID=UPI003EDA9D06
MTKEKTNDTKDLKTVNGSQKKTCFFITPIGSEDSTEYRKLEAIIENVINPVLTEFDYKIVVAHQINEMGSIGNQVFEAIVDSDLILTNLSGLNPNVMYETAVAHSFGKSTIMISENIGKKLPFDLIGDRVIFYSDSIEGTGKLIKDLRAKIKAIIDKNPDLEADNPITRVLNRTSRREDLVGKTDPSSEMMRMLLEMQDELNSQRRLLVSNDEISNIKENYDSIYERDFIKKNNYEKKILFSELLDFKKLYDQLKMDLGRAPTINELEESTNLSRKKIHMYLNSSDLQFSL